MALPPQNQWKTLDKDLGRIDRLEEATHFVARPLVAPGIALAFVALTGIGAAVFFGAQPGALVVIAAAVIGAYMALNIGANDVANNMGPAVGANALTLGGALLIAAVFETAGALIAGGDVVKTISAGIVAPGAFEHTATFIWAMMAALLAAALWLNLATWFGAPVSTTHSIVGGVVGAGIAAGGMDAVNWVAMGRIALSWVISPVLGGLIAALFLALIKARIMYAEDKIAAARRWVPVLIGIMAGAFAAYLALKGLSKVVKIDLASAVTIGLSVGVVAWGVMVPVIRRQSEAMENRKKSLKRLFAVPLVVSAALLSFAHGANDVANAVGPLAAIVHAVGEGDAGASVVAIPIWVMAIGAGGISFGLVLFGPKLIRIVGNEITKLNPMRAYCVALSAAVTVIVASWLGLPVSSTHIAVGAVFGVGFFREWHAERRARALGLVKGKVVPPEERRRRKLVRRSHLIAVAAAWVITVPASAALSALVFAVLRFIA
ncbi:inorganic phosphate transporter [Phaeovulum sp.]|uniref:inorganic phosphate transporter n=1 Tax=Phaeovulum sp. TaxID=2934796 RepID=UPI00272F0A4A|nr:inorganic phosphate transporter [Phaeovulum sp.]MDP1668890.1 inorganic phosphate transporter [Phaeovulum sp.]MDZ4119161.1 inorganic phosphate transporter [Phaeovulum sp.]